MKILPEKKMIFFLYFCSKHTLCRRGGSNEYPQCMFWNKNKKIRYTRDCKPQFYYTRVGYKGVFISLTCFHEESKSRR